MFDPKPVGGTELPTNRTSVIGYARYTSSATEVKTKGGRANNTLRKFGDLPVLVLVLAVIPIQLALKKHPVLEMLQVQYCPKVDVVLH